MDEQAVAENQALSFSTFVAAHEEGNLHHELSNDVREIIATLNNFVREHGGNPKASLTLSFDFKLEGGVIEVVAAKKMKLPEEPRARQIYWTTADNRLTARNPKQTDMFRDIKAREDFRAPNAG